MYVLVEVRTLKSQATMIECNEVILRWSKSSIPDSEKSVATVFTKN